MAEEGLGCGVVRWGEGRVGVYGEGKLKGERSEFEGLKMEV